ncbi:UNVERIFIED_ORG: glycosyltransferase involved in cell wall biosynthesis [Martelella mediterranea]
MRILHLIASVDPAGGGPVEYARLVAQEHAKAGHTSTFVTFDQSGSPFIADFPFPVACCGPNPSFPGPVEKFRRAVAQLADDHDIAVIHGLWNRAAISGHQALCDAGLPWVVFPHGMLDPWFRRAKPVKHWLKQLYWTLWQGRVLSQASLVLFTCEEEKRLARGAFIGHSSYRERVVAFCAADQERSTSRLEAGRRALLSLLPDLAGKEYLLFLSRIHPKKACDDLIRAFKAVTSLEPELQLVIAGPDQIGWQKELEALADEFGIAQRVHWPGMIQGDVKAAAFADARAFVLPSHQENFGLVVAEALSAGTPVLISTQVNIWREIEAERAGYAVSDTADAFEILLKRFLALSPSEAEQMPHRARLGYERHFSVVRAADDLIAALKESI